MLGGPVIGWFALQGLCNIPGLTMCGHNVIVLVPFFILGGAVVAWFGAGWLGARTNDAKRT